MRRILLVTLVALLAAVAPVLTPTAAIAQSGLYSGTWTSTDHDGSSQELVISGSGNGAYGMFLFDDAATSACGGAPARFVGSGVADGDTLVMFGTIVCLPGGNVVRHRIAIAFEYSSGDDTLTDETGVTWDRS